MLRRFWAYFLILICGLNAIGVSGEVYLSEKGQETTAIGFSSVSGVQHQAPTLVNGEHSADSHHDDCGEQHKGCHQCHLGHCNFLVSGTGPFVAPELIQGVLLSSSTSYPSIDLAGFKKPPRA